MASCLATQSNFTAPPWPAGTTWPHTAEAGKALYVVITYLTYAGEDVATATFNGIPMQKQWVSENAAGQFHTVEIFSLVDPPSGPGTVLINFSVLRAASFNVENGPADGSVVGVVAAMSGVTTRYLYGFGYDSNALVIGWFEVYNPQSPKPFYTVTDGNQLVSEERFAVGWKQGDGGETMLAFDTGGDTAGGEQFSVIFTIPSSCEAVSGGMRYPWLGQTLLGGGDEELPLPHSDVSQGTGITPAGTYLAAPLTLRNYCINLQTAPGLGASRRLRVYKNGIGTDLDVTISDLDTKATLPGVELVCHRWSIVTLRDFPSGGPAGSEVDYCIEAETGEAGVSLYGPARYGSNNNAPTLGVTGHANPFMPVSSGGGSDWDLQRMNEGRIGINGVLAGVFLEYMQREIGASAYDFYLWRSTDNGVSYVRQDGSGGTVNTYKRLTRPFGVAQPGVSFWYVGTELPLNVGDQVLAALTGADNTGGALNFIMLVNAVFRATTNGEWFFNGETINANALFYTPNSNRNVGGSGTESAVSFVVGPLSTPLQIPGINWAVQVAPGAGQSRTLTLRRNAANAIQSTISNTDIAGASGPTITLAEDDRFAMTVDPWVFQANWQTMWWTITGFMEPPPPPPPPECPGLVSQPRTDGLPYVPPVVPAFPGR